MRAAKEASSDDVRMQVFLGRLLRVGVTVAAVVSSVGAVLRLARGPVTVRDYHSFHGEPTTVRTFHGMLKGAVAVEPKAMMQLGLLILVATPVARVIASIFAFAMERDRFYVAVTLTVLSLLLVSLLGGLM